MVKKGSSSCCCYLCWHSSCPTSISRASCCCCIYQFPLGKKGKCYWTWFWLFLSAQGARHATLTAWRLKYFPCIMYSLITWLYGTYNSICKSYIVLQERDNRGRMLKQRSCGEQAGWRGTGRPNLTRETKASRGASRERESYILPVQPTTRRIDNHTRVVLNILKGMATLTHTHTHVQWIELFGQLFCWRPDDPLAPQGLISDHNQNFNVTMPSTRLLSTT